MEGKERAPLKARITFSNTAANREALARARVNFHPIGPSERRLLVPQVDPQHPWRGTSWEEYVQKNVTRRLQNIEGFSDWTTVLYNGEVLYVEFRQLPAEQVPEKRRTPRTTDTLSFQFDRGGSLVASKFDGVTDTPLPVDDASPLTALAKVAHAMYTHREPVENPKLTNALLLKAEVDDLFVQRLVAGRQLVVIADWNGRVPPVQQVLDLQDKLMARRLREAGVTNQERVVVSRAHEAAKIVASPTGYVTISYHRASAEEDELGLTHIVQGPAPETHGWAGHYKDPTMQKKWRAAAAAAVEAARKAEKDPSVAGEPVTWDHDDQRREPPKPPETPVDAT